MYSCNDDEIVSEPTYRSNTYLCTYSEYLGTHGELGIQLATLTYAYIFSDALKYDLP